MSKVMKNVPTGMVQPAPLPRLNMENIKRAGGFDRNDEDLSVLEEQIAAEYSLESVGFDLLAVREGIILETEMVFMLHRYHCNLPLYSGMTMYVRIDGDRATITRPTGIVAYDQTRIPLVLYSCPRLPLPQESEHTCIWVSEGYMYTYRDWSIPVSNIPKGIQEKLAVLSVQEPLTPNKSLGVNETLDVSAFLQASDFIKNVGVRISPVDFLVFSDRCITEGVSYNE